MGNAQRRFSGRTQPIPGASREAPERLTANPDDGLSHDTLEISARIRASELPSNPRAFVYNTSGDEGVCGCCDKLIDPLNASLRVEHGVRVVAMHPDCFCNWHAAAAGLQPSLGDDSNK
jgi:hypothetical protein